MIPLATPLDTIDFDALLALARRKLPALAPEWTDYNYHDPGITLVELLAWVADSQVYSLARNRHDERLAMARMLGVIPKGATPASGILYPLSKPDVAQRIERDSVLKPSGDSAPRMETSAEVTILPVEIKRLLTRPADGEIRDLTATNSRQRATFVPFGDEGTGELWIELTPSDVQLHGEQLLSIGVELVGRQGAEPIRNLGQIAAEDASGNLLRLVCDTTHGLQRSGVWIISLSPHQLAQRIVVRRKSGYPLRPRILQISPNAIPVEQRATVEVKTTLLAGGPGPEVSFAPALAFDADEQVDDDVWRLVNGRSSLHVDVDANGKPQPWHRGRLDEAGPGDRRYSLDEQPDGGGIRLRFGNGVNGRKPDPNDAINIVARLSTGGDGNMLKPIEWLLERQRLRFRNHFPIGGGRYAEDVGEALSRASNRLRDKRVLASPKQLIEALEPLLEPLEIARADVEEGWEEGRRTPSVAATRTLVVGHERPGDESAEWLRTIKQRLVPRIAVGERLIVKAPKYVPFEVSLIIEAVSGSDRAGTQKAIGDELEARFSNKSHWPLGRDVDASAVSGWVRKIEGVASVVDLKLVVDGDEQDHVDIGRGALPQFEKPARVSFQEWPT